MIPADLAYIFLQLMLRNATTNRHPRKEVKGKVKLSDIKEKIEDKMLDADFMSKFSLWVSIASLISAALTLYVTLKH